MHADCEEPENGLYNIFGSSQQCSRPLSLGSVATVVNPSFHVFDRAGPRCFGHSLYQCLTKRTLRRIEKGDRNSSPPSLCLESIQFLQVRDYSLGKLLGTG